MKKLIAGVATAALLSGVSVAAFADEGDSTWADILNMFNSDAPLKPNNPGNTGGGESSSDASTASTNSDSAPATVEKPQENKKDEEPKDNKKDEEVFADLDKVIADFLKDEDSSAPLVVKGEKDKPAETVKPETATADKEAVVNPAKDPNKKDDSKGEKSKPAGKKVAGKSLAKTGAVADSAFAFAALFAAAGVFVLRARKN